MQQIHLISLENRQDCVRVAILVPIQVRHLLDDIHARGLVDSRGLDPTHSSTQGSFLHPCLYAPAGMDTTRNVPRIPQRSDWTACHRTRSSPSSSRQEMSGWSIHSSSSRFGLHRNDQETVNCASTPELGRFFRRVLFPRCLRRACESYRDRNLRSCTLDLAVQMVLIGRFTELGSIHTLLQLLPNECQQ